jgi:dolichol-phosphate mannosyltransferase
VISESNLPTHDASINISVVIPCYKVSNFILDVINRIGIEVSQIYVVDDCCPEGTGKIVERDCRDPRVCVIYNTRNLGVGGAVLAGYQRAIADGATIIVKVDGDGQMAPELIPYLIKPIVVGKADYTKGNRFYDITYIRRMPAVRIYGNAVLSLMAKISTGYWDIFDPTNGYTAIHADVARQLPFDKISERYFFETDMLFRLNTLRAVVMDVPMDAIYGEETSNLRISRVVGEFFYKHLRNFGKRIFYNYFLRNVSIASLELVLGLFLTLFGIFYGLYHWIESYLEGSITPAGTVMLAALPVLIGFQLLLAFFSYDISYVPKWCIHLYGGKGFSETMLGSYDVEKGPLQK